MASMVMVILKIFFWAMLRGGVHLYLYLCWYLHLSRVVKLADIIYVVSSILLQSNVDCFLLQEGAVEDSSKAEASNQWQRQSYFNQQVGPT